MPTRVRDPYSGAILFLPTEEERRLAALEQRVTSLENKAEAALAPLPSNADKQKTEAILSDEGSL